MIIIIIIIIIITIAGITFTFNITLYEDIAKERFTTIKWWYSDAFNSNFIIPLEFLSHGVLKSFLYYWVMTITNLKWHTIHHRCLEFLRKKYISKRIIIINKKWGFSRNRFPSLTFQEFRFYCLLKNSDIV
jgi:hypothetical protein